MPPPSLGVQMLPKHETCLAFAQSITAKSTSDVLDRSLPLRRAQKLSCAARRRPEAASRNARVEFGISEKPLQSRVLLLKVTSVASPGRFEAHRTSSSKGVGLLRHTIFLTASKTVLPLPTSTSTSRSSGVICSASSFFPRGIGRLPWFAPPLDSLSRSGAVEGGQVSGCQRRLTRVRSSGESSTAQGRRPQPRLSAADVLKPPVGDG